VRLQEGLLLDEDLTRRIKARIREHASPRHVPSKIVQVAEIPRTLSGKIAEVAVRQAIHGETPANTEALANPASLALFRNVRELGN
jgi:acetoacetyl-CoA synthetase